MQRQVDAEAAVVAAEAALVKAKAELEDISCNILPNYMETELGLSELKLDDGRVVTNKSVVRGSLAQTRMREAQAWCLSQGIKTLIRESLTVDIGPEAKEKRDALVMGAAAAGLPCSSKLAAHPQTVAKFVRERLEQGKDVPETIFTIHRQNEVSIK